MSKLFTCDYNARPGSKTVQGRYNFCRCFFKKKSKYERKRKEYSENLAKIKDVPLSRRGSISSLYFSIWIPQSTLFDILEQKKDFKRMSSTVKLDLTDKNNLDRQQLCLSKVRPDGYYIFENWYNYVILMKNVFT